MTRQDLQGTVSIVTGGGSGIGKAIAGKLAGAGSSVTIVGRDAKRLRVAAEALGSAVRMHEADVSDEAAVKDMFDAAMKVSGGRLDLLVNSAGAFEGAPFGDLSSGAWRKVIDVNVTGPFLCASEAYRVMRASGRGGRIINIGSISGSRPRYHSSAYTTSKHALWGLTQSIALDGREFGISCSCLNPGNTMVERRADGHAVAGRDEGVEPLMDVDDIAELALLMATVPPNTNLLEATMLPVNQAFLGRG